MGRLYDSSYDDGEVNHDWDEVEDEDDPSTWDLTSDRAAEGTYNDAVAVRARTLLERFCAEAIGSGDVVDSVLKPLLTTRQLLAIVLEGESPDGGPPLSDAVRAYALDVVLRARDPVLWEETLIAVNGVDASGEPVDNWGRRADAIKALEQRRQSEFVTGFGLAHEVNLSRRSRRDDRAPGDRGSEQRIKSVDKVQSLLEDACARRGYADIETLARPFRRGALPEAEKRAETIRRAQLAVVIHDVRGADGKQVTLAAIAVAIGMSKQRVTDLAKLGEQLAGGLAA